MLTHKYRATSCISSQLKRVRMDLTVCNIQVVIGRVKTGVTVLTHSFIFYINGHNYFINITMPILGGMTEILITSMHIFKKSLYLFVLSWLCIFNLKIITACPHLKQQKTMEMHYIYMWCMCVYICTYI